MTAPLALVTGASGYIGGRLVPRLLEAGFRVRAMTRRPDGIDGLPWRDRVEVVVADVLDPASLTEALAGVDVAYYLVHSMGGGRDFAARDRRGAQAFADAAASADVDRIVYLSGIHPDGVELSPHMSSRKEVADTLLAAPVPAVVLRAAVILGSGSASFEMMRHLVERMPVMITPRWIRNRIQPIAVRDVLHYLVAAGRLEQPLNRTLDIAGPDVLEFGDLLQRCAARAELPRRRILVVPVLTPRLASAWIGLVTPVPLSVAQPLVASLVHESVAHEDDVRSLIPDPDGGLIGVDRAIELALARIRDLDVPTAWTSAVPAGAPSSPLPQDPDWSGGTVRVDERRTLVDASPEALWQVIEGIGGSHGWYSWRLGWVARGLMDRAFGGPGLRRGRRDPHRLRPGDALDWWRVETIQEGVLLRLRAEMRLPGSAWLELGVEQDHGRTVCTQRAVFHPRGVLGRTYWAAILPFHGIVFGGMQRNIARAAATVPPASPGRAEHGCS